MKVAFSVDYGRNDATLMCLRVAQLASDLGCDIEFLPREKPCQVHPFWDRFVTKNQRGKFEEWVATAGVDYLVYTKPPSDKELKFVKDSPVKPYLLVMWENLHEDHLDLLCLFDAVICPGKAAFQLLKTRPLKNLHVVPWDSGVPITFEPRQVTADRLGVIWPLEWQQAKRQDPKFLAVAEQLLESCPNVWLTVTYSQTISSSLLRDLRRVSTYGNGRVELMRNLSMDKQELLFGHHDLTIWPSLSESAALVGLASLSMGTPVIAFDHPTAADVVRDGRNGVLVQCEVEPLGVGGVKVKPDYPFFGRKLIEAVTDTQHLNNLRQNSVTGLRERREVFTSKWQELLC